MVNNESILTRAGMSLINRIRADYKERQYNPVQEGLAARKYITGIWHEINTQGLHIRQLASVLANSNKMIGEFYSLSLIADLANCLTPDEFLTVMNVSEEWTLPILVRSYVENQKALAAPNLNIPFDHVPTLVKLREVVENAPYDRYFHNPLVLRELGNILVSEKLIHKAAQYQSLLVMDDYPDSWEGMELIGEVQRAPNGVF